MADIASGRYNILRTLVEDFFNAVFLTRRHPLRAGDAISLTKSYGSARRHLRLQRRLR